MTIATSALSAKCARIDGIGGAVEQADIDMLVNAFVRIRSTDTLDGAIITRHWLAADMGVPVGSLDGLLKLLRWQGLIGLPNAHIVTVEDPEAMRAIALRQKVELESDFGAAALPTGSCH